MCCCLFCKPSTFQHVLYLPNFVQLAVGCTSYTSSNLLQLICLPSDRYGRNIVSMLLLSHWLCCIPGLGLFAPGSNGSNGGRPGSSHGHLGYAAGSSGSNVLLQHMRRSHSHQQLTDPLDVVAAAAAVGLSGGGTQSDSYALQRHSSSPPIGVALSSSIQQHGGDRSGNTRSSSGSRQGGAAGPSAAAAAAGPAGRSPSGPVTVPGFNPSMGGARRGMTRVESDVSQVGTG
jgi:hypothetical protein